MKLMLLIILGLVPPAIFRKKSDLVSCGFICHNSLDSAKAPQRGLKSPMTNIKYKYMLTDNQVTTEHAQV